MADGDAVVQQQDHYIECQQCRGGGGDQDELILISCSPIETKSPETEPHNAIEVVSRTISGGGGGVPGATVVVAGDYTTTTTTMNTLSPSMAAAADRRRIEFITRPSWWGNKGGNKQVKGSSLSRMAGAVHADAATTSTPPPPSRSRKRERSIASPMVVTPLDTDKKDEDPDAMLVENTGRRGGDPKITCPCASCSAAVPYDDDDNYYDLKTAAANVADAPRPPPLEYIFIPSLESTNANSLSSSPPTINNTSGSASSSTRMLPRFDPLPTAAAVASAFSSSTNGMVIDLRSSTNRRSDHHHHQKQQDRDTAPSWHGEQYQGFKHTTTTTLLEDDQRIMTTIDNTWKASKWATHTFDLHHSHHGTESLIFSSEASDDENYDDDDNLDGIKYLSSAYV